MKFIFLRMSPASGINKCWSKREQWRQQYLGGLLKHYKELLGSLVLSTVVLFTGAVCSSFVYAEASGNNGFKATPGHDETGGVGDREKQNWWLNGNNFQNNHTRIGDVKVGFDKYKFRMEYEDYRWLTIGAGY